MATRNKDGNENNTNTAKTEVTSYVAAAARLSASRPLGAPTADYGIFKYNDSQVSEDTEFRSMEQVAGLCVLDYIPTLGISKNTLSALNRAAFNEFNKIRCQISGNRTYEPVDHMIYRICVDSLRDLYMYMTRIYGTLRTYSAVNLYRPKAILRAMGLNFDDFTREAPALHQWLVDHAGALAPFPTVPIGKMTGRHNAYNSAYYTDGESPKAQTYIFNQVRFYSYEKVDEVKGLTLVNPGSTYQSFVDTWERMYAALQTSSDVYTIAADIRRAFGDAVITDLTAPAFDYVVPITKFDPILTSVMNASPVAIQTWLDGAIVSNNYDTVCEAFKITDGGDGGLVTTGHVVDSIEYPAGEMYHAVPGMFNHMNFVESEPDAAAICDAIRFKPYFQAYYRDSNSGEDINVVIDFTSVGTEVILGARVVCDTLGAEVRPVGSVHFVDTGLSARASARTMAAKSVFDWHLPSIEVEYTNMGVFAYSNRIYEDIQNYVPVTKQNIEQIVDAILLGEFGVGV